MPDDSLDILVRIRNDDSGVKEAKAALKELGSAFGEVGEAAVTLAFEPQDAALKFLKLGIKAVTEHYKELEKAATEAASATVQSMSNVKDATIEAADALQKLRSNQADWVASLTDSTHDITDALDLTIEKIKQGSEIPGVSEHSRHGAEHAATGQALRGDPDTRVAAPKDVSAAQARLEGYAGSARAKQFEELHRAAKTIAGADGKNPDGFNQQYDLQRAGTSALVALARGGSLTDSQKAAHDAVFDLFNKLHVLNTTMVARLVTSNMNVEKTAALLADLSKQQARLEAQLKAVHNQ
jgi:hypothetical protein